ncbi:GGDEF domain-containing protein [Marinomonas balearica]|uniref:diguanylate cyclase n=1 Tax=Marinomonas balearica TaxID=491947 RepID=A0A4R6M4S1_9GAMM|nr:GGDEF domain-containing protein [Marinomonas balearica]TDO96321.1 diguanylate cyclase (GGDEF)-like protein [Marinomonas balearica]
MANHNNEIHSAHTQTKDSGDVSRKLPDYLFTIVFLLTLVLSCIAVLSERQHQINDAKRDVSITIRLLQDHISDLQHDEAWRPIFSKDKQHIINVMDHIRTELNCRLYIVDENSTLLFKDSLLGPFGSDNGQQLTLIPALRNAIESVIINGGTATYKESSGTHLISSLPLSPRATLIGDAQLPAWYTAFSYSFFITLIIGTIGAIVVRYVIQKNSRLWRRQSLAQSIIDPLTSLPNRRGFELLSKQVLSCPEQRSKGLYLVVANINNLHGMNTQYGLDAGDTLIRQVAASIRHYLPKEDILCRWSGDEFLALVRSRELNTIDTFCRNISSTINKQDFILSGERVPLSIKIADHKLSADEQLSSAIVKLIDKLRNTKHAV